MHVLALALILSLPVIIAGGLHMAVVTLDLLPGLKIPLHREWFGANKTWRGVLVMPLAAALGVKIGSAVWPSEFAGWSALSLGFFLGLAYVVFELPNSYVKRRLGIPPGKRPANNAAVFALVDQSDSTIGCALVYWMTLQLPSATVLLIIVIGIVIHLVVNFSLYLMRLRKEPL